MQLYFLRHAIAADVEQNAQGDDSQRPLTDEGVKKMKKSAEGMADMGLVFDRIITSPYLRAQQTAQIVSDSLEFSGKIQASDVLLPNASYDSFYKLLQGLDKHVRVLFVGHLPSMAVFVSKLISRNGDVTIDLKKGSLCYVDLPEADPELQGDLKWFVTSKLLRGLDR